MTPLPIPPAHHSLGTKDEFKAALMPDATHTLMSHHNQRNIVCTSLSSMFTRTVEVHPEKVAVISEHESITFSELLQRSSDIAVYLRSQGVDADTCVAISVDPSMELIVCVLGILLAGGAYLPLSPEYPEERLRYMIEDARIRLIITNETYRDYLSTLAPIGVRIITTADVQSFARAPQFQAAKSSFRSDVRSSDLAYVIYTSGSTGKPKGVQIDHGNIVNQMEHMGAEFELDAKIILQKTPMSFDAAQWEILAVACGGTVVTGYRGIYRDIGGLIETIRKHSITTLQCVPTLLQALLDDPEFSQCDSLRQIFSGGEALTKRLAKQCLESLPNCTLINLYGPTECTINASTYVVDPRTVDEPPDCVSIGFPVRNTQFHALDNNHNNVPIGEQGELYISGSQVARGYLDKPDITADRFVMGEHGRMYKTGDLVIQNPDGSNQFVARVDNQVKVRGHRIELDEVRLAIERHEWIKSAAVVTVEDASLKATHLAAFVELNAQKAFLMDQGAHGSHHVSKSSRLQVKAQLANGGCRDPSALRGMPVIELPGKEATKKQRELVFGRKTYRFFDGDLVTKADLLDLLVAEYNMQEQTQGSSQVSLETLGVILRYFGQFTSNDRLLPKYGYASPGALYATQMYLEMSTGTSGLESGISYYHPVNHQLIRITERTNMESTGIKIHFVGKRRAIESVYKQNIREVLEIETGHMLGLFDAILPDFGLGLSEGEFNPDVMQQLQCNEDDLYLGTFSLIDKSIVHNWDDSLQLFLQSHPNKVVDMPPGQYQFANGQLNRISSELIQKSHVIAINQQVYERVSFGVTIMDSCQDWMSYIRLGRKLQQLQMNRSHFGLMSCGYSSKSGHNLPSANRIDDILERVGLSSGPSYFAVGGRISEEQWRSEGMREDAVHMKGPIELIKEDLVTRLPEYMVPRSIRVLERMPLTANGKVDSSALKKMDAIDQNPQPFVPPRSISEKRIAEIWKGVLKIDNVSVTDDFFECGGNSLMAVTLIHRMNAEFDKSLLMQTIFQAPTIEGLACLVDEKEPCNSSRLIPLHVERNDKHRPIYCWPGLGGYPMNLRLLGNRIDLERSFYGVQARGINEGESVCESIQEMATKDLEQIKCIQPEGPYTLWGYSFGARVAFEAACQLEQEGKEVEKVILIAPGSPILDGIEPNPSQSATFDNKHFVAMLYSVFNTSIEGPDFLQCLDVARTEVEFVKFVTSKNKNLQIGLVQRIIAIVRETYQFKYSFDELKQRRLKGPVTILKAVGDDYSFLEDGSLISEQAPVILELSAGHYDLLKKEFAVDELVQAIRSVYC